MTAARRVQRQAPRWNELAPLLQVAKRTGTREARQVARATNVAELRALARRRTPRSVFDYVDGGAGDEIAMHRARQAFDRVEFAPRVLRDVSKVSVKTTILGAPAGLPVVFAPTGFTRMMRTEGEPAVARVAAAAGIPYALSTMGTVTPDALAEAAPDGRRWFQLYVWRDRERSLDIIRRAERAGFEALVLTVDVPVTGDRLRDVRNGLTIPPTLNLRTFIDGALHPRWLFDFLTTPPPEFASMAHEKQTLQQQAVAMFDASVAWDDLQWFREVWPHRLVVKGVQRVDDAARLPDYGVDAVVLSNHGGRQLDRAVTPLELLPEVVREVGSRLEVMIDTGVRNGADVVAAVAMGASAVMVGRPYLYGLMAGGEAGVRRVVELFKGDVRRTMALLGATSIAELDRTLVTLRPNG